MKVLIVGGTGTVGCATAEVLDRRGVAVRCLTRSPEKLVGLPTSIEGRIGDLTDRTSLPACFDGCDAVFVVLALSPNEKEQGRNAVRAAVDAGLQKIVFMSAIQPPGAEDSPHLGGKQQVEKAVRESGLVYVVLRPNSFFQNELLGQSALVEAGVFSTPFGHKGVNRIDVRDVAEAAANVLTQDTWDNTIVSLHGPQSLTGPGMAETWSRFLGKPVAYVGDDLDAWQQSVSGHLPEWLTPALRSMYGYILEQGFRATVAEIEQSRSVVGRPLHTYEDFVRQTAETWKSVV